nr:hypothetical protein [Candidatus Sigynarchaeota archaeon]
MANGGDPLPKALPLFSNEKSAEDDEFSHIQQRILDITDHLLEHHYLLDLEVLYYECVRSMRDIDKAQIQLALNDLVRHKILINGKALTRQKLLENPNRQRILELVRMEPGIHFSRIKAAINKESRTVQWHLKMLVKYDFIREEKFGNNIVYFDFLLNKQYDRLHYNLHKDGILSILKNIFVQPGITLMALMDKLQLPRSTLMRKVKTLIDEGLVKVSFLANQMMSLVLAENIVPILQPMLATRTLA